MSEGSSLQPPIRSLWRSLALCTIVLSLLAVWSIGEALSDYRVDFLRSKWNGNLRLNRISIRCYKLACAVFFK